MAGFARDDPLPLRDSFNQKLRQFEK